MSTEIWVASALVLVIEGLLPALSPKTYRKAMSSIAKLDDKAIRSTGLLLMIVGAVLLYLIKTFR